MSGLWGDPAGADSATVHDHRCPAANSLGENRKGQVVGDAAGELVKRVEAAWREQRDPVWRPRADCAVEVRFDDLHALQISEVARCDDPGSARSGHGDDAGKTEANQFPQQCGTAPRRCRAAQRQLSQAERSTCIVGMDVHLVLLSPVSATMAPRHRHFAAPL
jgi:hypothetical protein